MIAAFLFAGVTLSQSAPQLQVQAEPSTVGVGEVVQLQFNATSAEQMPSDPQPGPTPGFAVRGRNSAPAQTHIIINGSRMDRYTLTTTWALEAQRTGTFHVGPPSVVIGGARYSSPPVTITVVPAGQAPRRHPMGQPLPPTMQNPFSLSPFDLWRGLVPGFDDDRSPPAESVQTDPKLALDAPRAPYYFLHATVDKTRAVVGEQVLFSVYEYMDVTAGRVEYDADHDASVADFVKRALLREDQEAPLAGYASVGGRTWEVKLVRRWALFPLHVGDLTIGPMHVRMLRPGPVTGSERATESLVVHATEPPLAGRPPGYVLGDVGRFSLAAQVSPREVDQGGAIGVHVELSGLGNLPGAIQTPAREGVEWLAPEVRDELGASDQSFGGKRTFDYVVRVRRAGPIDLGALVLPFWDPDSRKYDVSRAQLGMVRVAPSAAAAGALEEEAQNRLPPLPRSRDVLEGWRVPRAHWDDSSLFWLAGIGGCPLAFAVASAGRTVGRRARVAWRRRGVSPARELKQRLAAAMAACEKGDPRIADAAIARALEAATLAHAGVSIRGAAGGELVERLERAGVTPDAASRVADLLGECDRARFAPDAVDIIAARDRWIRAQGAIRNLEKRG